MNLLKEMQKQGAGGKPFIHRDGPEMGLHFTMGIVQSLMNLDEPDTLSLGYLAKAFLFSGVHVLCMDFPLQTCLGQLPLSQAMIAPE